MKKEYIITNLEKMRMKLFYATLIAIVIHVGGYFVMTQIKYGSSEFSKGSFWYMVILRILELAGIAIYFLEFADSKPFNAIFCFIPSCIAHGRYFVGNVDNASKTLNYYRNMEEITGMKGVYSLKFYLSIYLPIIISLVTTVMLIFFALYINGKMENMEIVIYTALGIIAAASIVYALVSLSSSLAYPPSVLEELFTRIITVCIMASAFASLVPKKQIITTIMASEEENKTYSSETASETEEEEEDDKETDTEEIEEDVEEEKIETDGKTESDDITDDTEIDDDEEKSED